MSTSSYHNTTVFQPSDDLKTEFEARLKLLGPKIEGFIKGYYMYSDVSPDELEDLIQHGLIHLWKLFQKDPLILHHAGDVYWLICARNGARHSLWHIRRRASSKREQSSDTEMLEAAEHRYIPLDIHETTGSDKRIDLERLIPQALERLTKPQQRIVKQLIPFVAQGYSIGEASEYLHPRTKARAAYSIWKAFQIECLAVEYPERQTPKQPKFSHKHEDEIERIRQLAKQNFNMSQIAQELGRSTKFVREHYEEATGYSYKSSRQEMTPEKIAQIKKLYADGVSKMEIARRVGCQPSGVRYWLNK